MSPRVLLCRSVGERPRYLPWNRASRRSPLVSSWESVKDLPLILGLRLIPLVLEWEWAGEQADRQVAFVVLEVLFLLAGEQALAGLAEQPIGPAAAQDTEQDLENYFCRQKLFARG